ncbi:DUF6326 family protein [Dactylosporangium sp. AC04546]|uniref:DUF6326 family protein n=1 Tax=Dactylosporangium sp. AC04546 TaxID=2862460 RepID=UPI001EDEF86F|nr:DUF6326 family protein [Dactylosporangium sp. AC04546]WVK85925.1 DUF6326 family protein [Dactylosporangium sp. AC04546]
MTRLSALWTFAVLNYLYCDVLGHMDADVLNGLLDREVDGMRITPGFLFGAGVLMEIPIAMVLLSLLLPWRANRIANLVAGSVMTLVQGASLLVGTPTAYYVLYSVFEIGATAAIVWLAWKWAGPQAPAPSPADRASAAAG